jgi:arachidonate 5-lipoxygenase
LNRPASYQGKEHPWYIETIKVSRIPKATETLDEYVAEEASAIVWEEFPIYSWIFPSTEVQYFFTNKTSILTKESTTRKLCKMWLKRNMKDYVSWMPQKDKLKMFPGYISEKSPENLHINLRFTDDKQRDFTANRITVLKSVAFASVRNNFKDFFEFQDYSKAAKQLNKHKWMGLHYLEDDKWMEDEEFGRQMLNGMNPALIELCTTLPDNFLVLNEDVTLLLSRGMTLQEEILQGNVYIIDLKILQDISTGSFPPGSDKEEDKLQLAVPLCLLYHDSDGHLRPIAIQLGQEPGPKFPVWTPNDGKWAWLLAKMWFRNAEHQVHQIRCHLALTHLLVEPIAIATFRCLPAQHPVHKLLREHLYYVVAINVFGRLRLISPVSLFL